MIVTPINRLDKLGFLVQELTSRGRKTKKRLQPELGSSGTGRKDAPKHDLLVV